MNTLARVYWATALIVMLVSVTAAKSEQSAGPQFEVATIKPTRSMGGIIGGSCHGVDSKYNFPMNNVAPPLGRCVFSRTSLKALLRLSYHPTLDEAPMVIGGESWTDSEAYDVEGKAEDVASATQEQLRLMTMSLLRDRFKLTFHIETREEQGYLLRTDPKGSKLKVTSGEDPHPGELNAAPKGSSIILPPAANGDRTISVRAVRTLAIANFLRGLLDRPVKDDTGLDGLYDVTLTWSPSVVDALAPSSGEPAGPNVITAVREQLGLRLESGKVSVEYLVIDHAERPSEP